MARTTGVRRRLDRMGEAVRHHRRSLLGRIVLLVLLATGLTALLAAWTSTATIRSNLDDRIEQHFTSLLNAKHREVTLWYRQARLDLDTFARSATVLRNMPRLATADAGPAREELRTYLEIIQQQFDVYPTLYLVSADGSEILHVGQGIALPDAIRGQVPEVGEPRTHDVIRAGGERLQFASVGVPGTGGAGLHGAIDLAELDAELAADIERAATGVYLVDQGGRYVAGTRVEAAETFVYRGPGPDQGPSMQIYVNSLGNRVVGGARSVAELGWTIAVEQDYEVAFEPVGALVARVVWIDMAIGLALVLVAGRLAVSITRPVGALSRAAQKVADGDTEVRLEEPRGAAELVQLTRAFNQMTHHLAAQRRKLERQNDELQQLSVTDGLTGAYNRRYFEEQLPIEVKRAQRADQRLALIVLDIDHFKRINDDWGHAVGDDVLCAVARTLATSLRETDLLARYGGEEFVVLNLQPDLEGARMLAEKMREAVAALEWPLPDAGPEAGTPLRVTLSAGVALHAGDDSALFRDADAALYRAKREGRDRVVVAAADGGDPAAAGRD